MQPVAFAFLNMFYKVFRFRPEMHKKIRSASKNTKPYYNNVIYALLNYIRLRSAQHDDMLSFRSAIANRNEVRRRIY